MTRRYGSARVGIVQALRRQVDGTPVVDVLDTHGGIWLNCRFLASGGGGSTRISYAPPQPADNPEELTPSLSAGSEVILLFTEGPLAHPYVLASTLHPETYKIFSDELPTPTAEEDYPSGDLAAQAGISDHLIEIEGVRLLVSEHGVVLDTKRASKPVRVQLPSGQFLRVSLDEEADERVLLGLVTQTFLTALAARVDFLTTAVSQIESHLSDLILKSIGPPLVEFPDGIQVVDAAGNPLPNVLATIDQLDIVGSGQAASDVLADPVGAPGDDILASAMRISEQSKVDEGEE